MADGKNAFFYDSQIRRFIIQFIRLMSGFQVQYSDEMLKVVPVMYGDPSRQAMAIVTGNNENFLNAVPAMSAYVTELEYDRERMQDPYFVDTKHVRMRAENEATGELTTEQGNAFTINRLMPVPYLLKMTLDIWTSNTTQKLQLLEQIAPLFNPSFEIQSSDNYFDWTSLTIVKLMDTTWSSRTVGMGMDSMQDSVDIASMSFEIPIWLSPPAKVKKLGVIHRVVNSIYDVNLDDDPNEENQLDDNLILGQRVRVTPSNYSILLLDGVMTIHRAAEIVIPDNDDIEEEPEVIQEDPKITWDVVFTKLGGNICPGISRITLLLQDELNEVTGTIIADEDDPNSLFFTVDVDTIPPNDMDPVDAVIDPLLSGPGTGLPAATLGQRYLLVNAIGDASNTAPNYADAWEGTGGEQLIASIDDIVEYDGTEWLVDFDASESLIEDTHFLTNVITGIQYGWVAGQWIKSYEGEYKAGFWFVTV